MKKKLLAIFLTVCMTLTLIPNVFAQDVIVEGADDIVYTEELSAEETASLKVNGFLKQMMLLYEADEPDMYKAAGMLLEALEEPVKPEESEDTSLLDDFEKMIEKRLSDGVDLSEILDDPEFTELLADDIEGLDLANSQLMFTADELEMTMGDLFTEEQIEGFVDVLVAAEDDDSTQDTDSGTSDDQTETDSTSGDNNKEGNDLSNDKTSESENAGNSETSGDQGTTGEQTGSVEEGNNSGEQTGGNKDQSGSDTNSEEADENTVSGESGSESGDSEKTENTENTEGTVADDTDGGTGSTAVIELDGEEVNADEITLQQLFNILAERHAAGAAIAETNRDAEDFDEAAVYSGVTDLLTELTLETTDLDNNEEEENTSLNNKDKNEIHNQTSESITDGNAGPQIGDVIWIRKGSLVLKDYTDTEKNTHTLLGNYEVKIKNIISNEDGLPLWYEFEFKSLGFGEIWLGFSGFKYVRAENTSTVEPPVDHSCNCGEGAPEDLSKHADSCPYKQYVKSLFENKSAAEIYSEWDNYDEALQNDILNMLKTYDKEKHDALNQMITECICSAEGVEHQKGCPLYAESVPALPTFPSCDCSGGDYAGHDEDCAYAEYMTEQYFGTVTTRDIYAQWESLDENAREGILGMMEAMDPNSLQELRAMLNGEANEVATIVDGMTIIAVGAIPDGVTMAVKSIDAETVGFDSALFAYDISFTDEDGVEWQPSGSTVKVTIDAAELGIENGTYVKMDHIADDGTKETVGRYMVSGGYMTFEAANFSGYVGTADGRMNSSIETTDVPITINLFDYGSLVTNKSTRDELAIGMGGTGATVFDYVTETVAPTTGVTLTDSYAGLNGEKMGMYPVLQNGYPARAKSGGGTISLDYLFNKSLAASTSLPYEQSLKTVEDYQYSNYDVLRYPVNVGNLFNETAGGYFEFDSRDNHVWYSPENGGTLYVEDYAVNPDYMGDRRYSGIGHFLPFNGPITQYDLTASTGDAYLLKENGTWKGDYQSKADTSQKYTVNAGNFVNTQADTLYAIKKGATVLPRNRTNMWVGMSVEFDFNQPQDGKKNGEDMVFEFSGDDLMWVYIDNVMILDIAMSGTHDRNLGGAKTATINFSTGEVIAYKVDSSILDIQSLDTNNNGFFDADECNDTFDYHVAYHTTLRKLYEAAKDGGYISTIPEFKGETFADFETLSFKMFYMDTGHGTSNCSLKFNMDPLPAGNLSVKKVETELNEEFCGETEYEFELYKKADGASDFTKVTNATFTIAGEGAPAANDISGDTYTIGDDGVFKLKGNQTATFITGVTVKDTLYVKEITTGNLYTTTYAINGSTANSGTETSSIYINYPDDRHDVVFTNQWKTADLTIDKKVIGEVGDVAFSLALKHEATSNNFDLSLKHNDSITIENLPVGYEFTLKETDPSTGAFRYQAPEYNGTTVAFRDAFTYTVKEGSNSISVKNRCLTDLKIIKNLTEPAKENQSFLFSINDLNNDLNIDVILTIEKGQSTASVTIKDVVVGSYTVVEDENWSWRYEIDETAQSGNSKQQTVSLSSDETKNEVAFTNKRTQPFWLSGDSWCRNWWGEKNGTAIKASGNVTSNNTAEKTN